MKLDRNQNLNGWGKYALVNMRKLCPEMEKPCTDQDAMAVRDAFLLLLNKGFITTGTEDPYHRFFVMKYKDRFAAPALNAYAKAVIQYARELIMDPKVMLILEKQLSPTETPTPEELAFKAEITAQYQSLMEYGREIFHEYFKAMRFGIKVPN